MPLSKDEEPLLLVHQVSDWGRWRCDQNGPSARRDEGAYLNRYVTEEQRSRRPIFIATFALRVFWPAALSLIGQRPQLFLSLGANFKGLARVSEVLPKDESLQRTH
jgi:hypothetical protein